MTTTVLAPVDFYAPLVNPSPNGLYAATNWQPDDGPPRWLAGGVEFHPFNYGGADSFGVWGADWCASADDLTNDDVKTGERAELGAPFEPIVAWAFDACDLTAGSQAEVVERAQQNLRLIEQPAVEREFADTLLIDAGTPDTATDIVAAVAQLEGILAETNTLGFVHASAMFAAAAAKNQLIVRSGSALKTPLGHTWVFGGGYVQGLGAKLVATSPTYGWRSQVDVRDAVNMQHNKFAVVAERSVLIGYEAALGAVTVTG